MRDGIPLEGSVQCGRPLALSRDNCTLLSDGTTMKGRQCQQHLRSGQRRHMSFDMFRHISSSLLIMLATWWLSIFWIANRFTQRNMVAYVLRFTDNASSTQSKLSSPKWMLFDQIHRDQFCPSTVSQRIFKKIKLPWSSRTSLHWGY